MAITCAHYDDLSWEFKIYNVSECLAVFHNLSKNRQRRPEARRSSDGYALHPRLTFSLNALVLRVRRHKGRGRLRQVQIRQRASTRKEFGSCGFQIADNAMHLLLKNVGRPENAACQRGAPMSRTRQFLRQLLRGQVKRRHRFLYRADALIEIGSERDATSLLDQLRVTSLGGFTLSSCVGQSLGELVKFSTQGNDLLINSGDRGVVKTGRQVSAAYGGVMLAARIFDQCV